tara:strand:+ start:824 stop:1363 length:540 start_codon:yes stop_codon:yes gene_type:complete
MKQLRPFTLILIFILLFSASGYSQKKKTPFSISVEQNTFLSYTGLNVSMLLVGNYKKHSLGVGINTSIQNSYFPYQRTNGVIVDYRYHFLSNEKIEGFVSLNYNNKNYSPIGRNVSQENKVHEYVYSNGFVARLYKGLWVGNSIGFGGYTERYYDNSELTFKTNMGFNYRLNAIIKYDF